MPGTPVSLGPWPGGMNNSSEIATIADDEVALLENFEQDTDGSLVSRPAIILEGGIAPPSGFMQPLGYYIDATGAEFLVTVVGSATYLYNTATKAWTQIWANIASDFVQYDNKAVLISESTAGGYWNGTTFTVTPTMPKGSQIVFYQERFWAYGAASTVNATTVWFSKLTVISPASSIFDWVPASDYFTVGLGDGEVITALQADLSSLLIFKARSTWQFSYPSAPASGTLRQISSTIGADNRWSIVSYENYYMIYCAGFVYQFMNFRHYPLNRKKIDFRRNTAAALRFNIRLSIFGQRLMVWFFGTLYVYNITAGTWSTWVSASGAGHFFAIPDSSISGESRVALAVSGLDDAAKQKLWRIEEDVLASGAGEAFTCTIRTKAYNLNEAAQYKRLMYWVVEVNSASGVNAIAHPVTVPLVGVTWNDLDLHTWNDLEKGSWNNPVILLPTYVDNIDFPTAAPTKAVVKIQSAFRFLSVFFEVFLACDGTAASSPVRIYSITPYIKIKANVSSKVS